MFCYRFTISTINLKIKCCIVIVFHANNYLKNIFIHRYVFYFKGDSYIPIPHFHPKQAPCAPGYMVLRKNRELGEFLRHKQSQYVLTEYLWDFAPEYYGGQRSLLKTSSKYEDNKKQFEYKTSRTINGLTKMIKFTFNGQDISTLDESPDRMVVDLDLFGIFF